MLDKISFTSKIIPVTDSQFEMIASRIGEKYHAKYPWELSTSVIGKDVFTKRICDCTSCLVTDGDLSDLSHLNPSTPANHSLSDIREYFRNNFNLNKPNLHAIVVGSRNTSKSLDVMYQFLTLLKESRIPVTLLRNSESPVDMAYLSAADAVLISSPQITKAINAKVPSVNIINSAFKQVVLSPFDIIV